MIPPGSRIGLIAEGAPDLDVIADFITRLLRPDLQLLPGDRRRLAPKPRTMTASSNCRKGKQLRYLPLMAHGHSSSYRR